MVLLHRTATPRASAPAAITDARSSEADVDEGARHVARLHRQQPRIAFLFKAASFASMNSDKTTGLLFPMLNVRNGALLVADVCRDTRYPNPGSDP